MKTPEDEAFDDLARKQGAWGGGFPAKRQMAMDKINSEFHEEYKKMHEDRVKYGTAWSQDGKRIDPMSVYKESAQEPPAQKCPNIKNCGGACFQCEYFNAEKGEMEYPVVQPAQEPDWKTMPKKDAPLINWAKNQTPPQREWVELTRAEFAEILCDDRWQGRPELMMLQVQAKLKDKNT